MPKMIRTRAPQERLKPMTAKEIIAAATMPVTFEEHAERQEALRKIVERARRNHERMKRIMNPTQADLSWVCSI